MRRFWIAVILLLGLAAAPARAEWRRAESPNFVVYGEMSEARLRQRVILLEEYDRFLRTLTATTAPPAANKLRVYLVHGREMQLVLPVGGNIGGFYRPGADGMLIVADENQNWTSNEDDTLLHEYAHHFMMQYHPAPYPAWYVEGFAEYVGTVDIRPERIEYGNFNRMRAFILARRDWWIRYDRLLFEGPRGLNGFSFYSQSWLMVHYIMADEGRRAAFRRYAEAVARGEDPRAAFTAAFGMSGAAIDRTLRAYAQRITFHRLTRAGPPPEPAIRFERIAGADTPLIEAALLLGVRREDRARMLARARQAGRGDDFGRRLQARAEILYGDGAAAERLLAALPNDAETLYLAGLRHLVAGRRDPARRAAEYRAAQPYFARAFRADPNHFPSLYRYVEALSAGDRLLSDNSENVLLLAVSLAPQVADIRLDAAHLLLLRDKFEQAQALLSPLLRSFHDQSEATRLNELLRLARARERPTETIVFKTPDAPAAAAGN